MYLKPGDSHPLYPHWKVEQVFHSPSHMGLTKFQWVRRDGTRATLMGFLGLFEDKRPWYEERSSNIGTDFDIQVKDKNVPMGPPDDTLTTIRWYSWEWAKDLPLPEGAAPMNWSNKDE